MRSVFFVYNSKIIINATYCNNYKIFFEVKR